MVLTYFAPSWFFGIDVALELAFAVISLAVALFAFRMYRETSQRLIGFFGLSFLLISLSYLVQSVLNFLIISRLNAEVCRFVKLHSVAALDSLGTITHMSFMTIGLSLLLYTTLKDRRLRTLWLLLAVALASVFGSRNSLYMFYLISTIYLAFISWHYIQNYLNKRQATTLMVALAFLFLLFGSFHFIVSVNHRLFYAIGHILELFAYILILLNLYMVQRP